MPFPVAHSLTGLTIASLSDKFPAKKIWYETLLIALLANLPDFDFGLVFITGDWQWHRAFSHSISAAIVVGALTCLWYLGKLDRGYLFLYSAVVLSHPILDIITTPLRSNMGVMLFWPLSESRFGAGLMRYPFHDWASYHGLELVVRFVFISIFEFITFAPILLAVITVKRFWIGHFGNNYKTTTAE